MNWRRLAFLPALAACLAAPAAFAEDDGPGFGGEDARVKRALEEEGFVYRIDENWRFLLTCEGVEEDRTQLVIVDSSTSLLDSFEIREVYGAGYNGPPLGKARLQELLESNARYKLGAWEISPVATDEDGRRTQRVRFSVKLPADASPETLRTAILCVSDMCDRLESDWLETDEL